MRDRVPSDTLGAMGAHEQTEAVLVDGLALGNDGTSYSAATMATADESLQAKLRELVESQPGAVHLVSCGQSSGEAAGVLRPIIESLTDEEREEFRAFVRGDDLT